MLTALFIVFLGACIYLLLSNCHAKVESDYSISGIRIMFSIISLTACLGLFIALMCLIPKVATESTYETRIAVVQESNSQLEGQICAAVESYLKHEENVYEKLNVTTAIGLFSAYPNLKSNELVQSLINTYQRNTEEIKALKLQKTNLAVAKFLVYFGH